jgi:hypothetical protein
MDIRTHFIKNQFWWFKIILFSFIINLVFPLIMYEDKSYTYNAITNSLGAIFGGLLLFVLIYLLCKLFPIKLNDNDIKRTLIVSFAFWWTLQVLTYFDINLI